MLHPFISIITVCFNSTLTIKDTVESVLNQTYQNIEYIIIDGNSTDETLRIIKSYQKPFQQQKIPYKWISEPDKGIYDAMNKGIALAKGEWLVFIGSDDYYKDNLVIENTISSLQKAKNKNIRYVYGKTKHINFKNELIEISGQPWEKQKKRFPYVMNINHSGSFHHKTLFSAHGSFDTSFKIAGDYEFLLRELKDLSNNALFINTILIVMREGGVSGRLNNRLSVVTETQRARRENGINTFSKELFFWELRVRMIRLLSTVFGDQNSSKLADFYRKVVLGKQKRWSK